MVEPALAQVMIGLGYFGDVIAAARLGDDVAIVTGTPLGEHACNRSLCTARPCVGQGVDLLGIAPNLMPRDAVEGHRYRWATVAVECPNIGNHLIRLAVAQRAVCATDTLKRKAVTGLAVLLHAERQEARAIGARHVAIFANERFPTVHRLAHPRDTVGR